MVKPTKTKKGKKQEPQVSEAELRRRHDRFVLVFESAVSLFRIGLYCATVLGFAYITFYLPLTVAPGETTVVQNVTRFLGDIKANIWVAWGVAGSAGLWARWERRLRLKEREKRESRIRELEKMIDPSVTSSKMNLEGSSVLET